MKTVHNVLVQIYSTKQEEVVKAKFNSNTPECWYDFRYQKEDGTIVLEKKLSTFSELCFIDKDGNENTYF